MVGVKGVPQSGPGDTLHFYSLTFYCPDTVKHHIRTALVTQFNVTTLTCRNSKQHSVLHNQPTLPDYYTVQKTTTAGMTLPDVSAEDV